MSKMHRSVLAILVLSLGWSAGCNKTTQITEVQGASTGTMIGIVSLYEMDGTPSDSSAGVDVAILGTNRHATTDSTGHFVFDSLPAGYYQMEFTKPGFSTYITDLPEPFVGSDTLWLRQEGTLYRINNWKVTIDSIQVTSLVQPGNPPDTIFYLKSGASSFTVLDSNGKTFYANGQPPTLTFFLGQTPNIDYHDTSTFFSRFFARQYNNTNFMSIYSGSTKSDTVYLAAYPTSGTSPFCFYYSGDTMKYFFTGLGQRSNVVKIVLP